MAGFDDLDFAGTPRFAVERMLGAGGMGVVYLAHDVERDVPVALKVLPTLDPAALSRFKREFRSLAEIIHPNLVELYELVAEGDRWFFTMAVVEGVDFLRWVRAGPPDQSRLREALAQLVRGVEAIHAAGRLHRDLKPHNVMVRPSGEVVILDFGLVAELGRRADHLELAGTAAYMAPEQWGEAPLTGACDWYSVGVMLYEALTGTHPFTGNRVDSLQAKLGREAPPPSLLKAGVPEDLDALCRDLLRRDPAERPGADEILARLGADRLAIPMGSSPLNDEPAELVGREREMALLGEAFEGIRQGATVTAHVQGPSGTGKTALVDRFLRRVADDPDVVLLRGRCYEQESVPYKALDSLVDALADHLHGLAPAEVQPLVPVQAAVLARVFPVLQRVPAIAQAPGGGVRAADPRELRRAAMAALRELLTRLGQRRDLVLAIDDLQWGDLDSAVVIGELLAPPDPPRVLMVLSYRSEYIDRSPCLATLHHATRAGTAWQRRIDVPITPLSPAESEELARQLLRPDSAVGFASATRIARESGGNPYFLFELSRHVDAERGDTRERARAPLELDEVLWNRAQRLPTTAREILAVVAVAGQPIALRHLLDVAPSGPDVMHALALLKAEHFVRGTGLQLDDHLETWHDRVRESVVARLPDESRRRHHAGLARTFEADGGVDAETVAEHYEHAGELDRAGRHYARAAEAAAIALAFDRAATLYRNALRDGSRTGAERATLLRELGHALVNAGRGYDAAQAYESAVPLAPPEDRFELERLAAAHYCFSGHIREGRAIFRRLLAQVGLTLPSNPVRILASLVVRRTRLRLRGVKYVERQEAEVSPDALRRIDLLWSIASGLSVPDALGVASLQTKGLLLALDAGEPYRVARALAFEAFMASVDGLKSASRSEELIAQAEALANRLDHPHARGVVLLMREMIALNFSRFEDVVRYGEAAEETLRTGCSGVWWEIASARTEILWSLWHQGDCAALRQRTPVILSDALDRGDLYLVTNVRSVITPFLALLDDDPDQAIREVGEALAPWPREGFNLQHANEMFSETNALIYRGRGVEALEAVDRRWPALRRSLQLQTQLVRTMMTDLRARATLAAAERDARPERLIARAERDARRLARERTPMGDLFAHCIRAGVAALRGETVAAADLLGQAQGEADRERDGFRRLFTRYRLGALPGAGNGALRQEAEGECDAQGIRNPARLAAVFLPGFRA